MLSPSRRIARRLVALALAGLALVVGAGDAAAVWGKPGVRVFPPPDAPRSLGVFGAMSWELLIPDYWLEWSPAQGNLGFSAETTTLTWGLPVTVGTLEIAKFGPRTRLCAAAEARGEVHYRPRGEQVRGLAAVRVPVFISTVWPSEWNGRPINPCADWANAFAYGEIGTLWGDEGEGGVLGAGIMMGSPTVALGLGWRRVGLAEVRHALTIDLHVSLSLAGLIRGVGLLFE